MRAGITSGLNHNHLALSIRFLAICFLPAASTTKEMGGSGSSPRMRVLLAPGSTHDPRASWRANFYRVEGSKEPRAYLAWQATRTAQPNFHVPRAFGKLRFAGAGGV